MAYDTDAAGELLAKQMQAFDLVLLQKKSLRAAGAEMGCSHTAVKAYVTAYKKAVASDRVTEDVEERRAAFDAELEMLKANALAVYAYCMKGEKKSPLAAVGALNSYTATLTHQRAVQGLDTPKAVEAKVDTTYRVYWDEGDDQVATPQG